MDILGLVELKNEILRKDPRKDKGNNYARGIRNRTATKKIKESWFNTQILTFSVGFCEPPVPMDVLPKRQQWSSPIEFTACCICALVGLGNIWRFPYMAYENGGGPFLIAYLIVLVLIGRPLYYLELTVGQFASRGNIKLFSALGRGFIGIGVSQTFCSICAATYYSSIIAISLFYFLSSLMKRLPWSYCKPEWGNNCIGALTHNATQNYGPYITSAELFFTKDVLREIENIDHGIGIPDWRLCVCLFVSWLTTFLVLTEGVKASGKAAYFLIIFAYIALFFILGIAASLEGAFVGICYFIKPKWSKLLDPNVWFNAVSQCCFSLGMGFGSVIMFASLSAFDWDVNRVCFVITVIDTLTSVLSGITTFAVLGHLASQFDVDIQDVVKSGGLGLAFISYPTAISHIEFAPNVMSAIFFLVLFALGIASLVLLQQVVNGQITDFSPTVKHWQVAAVTSTVGFLLALIYVTPGGMFLLTLVDSFCVSKMLYVVITVEVLSILYGYGLQNFCWDVEFMVKQQVGRYWRIVCSILAPIILISIYVYYLASSEPIKYRRVQLPFSAEVSGWVLYSFGVLAMPLLAFYQIFKNRDLGCPAMLMQAFSNEEWGPTDQATLQAWKVYRNEEMRKRGERGDNTCTDFFKTLINK